ncbi:MAG: ferritin family protein [Deltaproteobacteria bacterium]
MAWNGQVATGPVELNMDLVRGDESPTEITRLAYGMEMSLGNFYQTMGQRMEDKEVIELLSQLASIEEKHKQYLLEMLRSIEHAEVDQAALESDISTTILEGGFDTDEFITKNEEFMRTVTGLLDVAMMLEAQALDLYLRFAEKIESGDATEILYKIGDEEKGHLAALGRLREEKM